MKRFKHFVLVMALLMSILILAGCSLGAPTSSKSKTSQTTENQDTQYQYINLLNLLVLLEPMKSG